MRRLVAAVCLALFTFCSFGSLGASQPENLNSVPSLIRYHGSLINPDGTPRSGYFAITFSLYADADSGSALWSEVQNVVADRAGRYTVLLGAESKDGVPIELFSTNDARYLGTQVETEPEQSRVLLVSVPYALKARDSELFGGHPISDFLFSSAAQPSSDFQPRSTSTTLEGALVSTSVSPHATLGASAQNYIVKSDGLGGFLPSVAYESGGNFGIGTTAPGAKLDVQITSASPISAINSSTTLTNSVPNSTQIVTALNLMVRDNSTASNFSKQTMRLDYYREGTATGGVDGFDTVFTASPVIDSDAPYTLIGLNMEGPNVKAGKTLGTFYGAMIGAVASRGGIVNNRYALVTNPGAGNVGINTLFPVAPLNIVADNPGPTDRASQFILQGSANPKLRLNLGIHTEASPAFADMGLIEEGVGWRNLVFGYGGGSVGIGTANTTSRLTVNGMIESLSGGIKFPDGTVQISANTSGGGTGSVSISSPDNSIQVGGNLSSPMLTIASVALNKLSGASCSTGNQLQWNGSSWACGTLSALDSSIQVNANGAATTISVPDAGISTAKLADASITTTKISDGSITVAKLAPGLFSPITSPDSSIIVGGTAMAPTLSVGSIALSKLSGGMCTPGTLLQWNGSSWSCTSLAALDSSITVASLGSLSTIAVSDQGITTAKLADGSVTSAKLAPGLLSSSGIITTGQNDFTGEQSVRISSPTTSAITAVNSGTTGSSIGIYSETASTTGLALKARAANSTGTSNAIYALNESTTGYGIYSLANATTGLNIGAYGYSRSSAGIGLKGETNNTAGTTYGVYGITNGGNYSAGVYGTAQSTTAADVHYGVYGRAAGVNGIGVIGFAANTTPTNGAPIGVLGVTASPVGVAGRFANTAATGDVIIARNSTDNIWRVDNSGNVWANGVTHVGGADFAEGIQPVKTSRPYEPGDLLAISTGGDRQVELATEPYSPRVLGIYATKPGVLASRYGVAVTGEELPVAMIGIVPAKASAENGPIQRGDLLVSASTPGHVMRATDRQRLTGAIVGKAMQSLDSGTGVIEIAVTLQ